MHKFLKISLLFNVITLLLLSKFVMATEINFLNPIESLKIKSKYFEKEIEYNVTLPQSYSDGKDKKYFVIFDLHPRSQPFLSGLHDWLSHNGEWPWLETIVVTPKGYNAEFAKQFEMLVSEPNNHAILDYLEHDLLKAIDANYRTNGFRIYSGFMSNAAFGLYALLNRPSLFNAYIITTPTLADDFGEISSQAASKLKTADDRMRFLYLVTGEHQYEKNHLVSIQKFEKDLQNFAPKTLNWQVQYNKHSHYMSQPIVSVINGIQTLFEDIHTDLPLNSEISKAGVEAIIDYYTLISEKKYGFEVSAQGSLTTLAESLLKGHPQQALALYHKIVTLYPDSAYGWSSLAKAYAETGDLTKAVEYQTLALEKSKTMIQWHQNKHKQYLQEYNQKLDASN